MCKLPSYRVVIIGYINAGFAQHLIAGPRNNAEKVFDELRREEPVFKKLLEVVLHFGTKF